MNTVWCLCVSVVLYSGVLNADSTQESESCAATNLWADLLEQWTTSADYHNDRHGRVMALPPTTGYYVTERIDGPLSPPPPPPHGPSGGPYGPAAAIHGPQPYGPATGPQPGHGYLTAQGPHAAPHGPAQYPASSYSQYEEWKATPPPPPGAGKIVNRPPNPYKDKFKPSYQLPPQSPQNQPIPVPHQWGGGGVDRVDGPSGASPPRRVSETDLYLLTAIEKLVYRADTMEKRLRKLEDALHYIVAGKEPDAEPCANGFQRVADRCYSLSSEAADWKAASVRCRKLHAHLLELHGAPQRQALLARILADHQFRGHRTDRTGKDFWTGGLNPGLLWIWSHSARPVNDTGDGNAGNNNNSNNNNGNDSNGSSIPGQGRCLALVPAPARDTYLYQGHDCALTHRSVMF
ncbi:unnamed protein product [Diatraea saccharalis]|uniref:C-type lectin domain-containing protein n=1 Tax=Diatraea saccharalis TaxID=40085 RepID=A0A9N9N0E9_9NEOP|nr:unnamed protein product [Diatraea saccharalis]